MDNEYQTGISVNLSVEIFVNKRRELLSSPKNVSDIFTSFVVKCT